MATESSDERPCKQTRLVDADSAAGAQWTIIVKHAYTGTEICKATLTPTSTVKQLCQHVVSTSDVKGVVQPMFAGALLDATRTLIPAGLSDNASVEASVCDFCAAICTSFGDYEADSGGSDCAPNPAELELWNVLAKTKRTAIRSKRNCELQCAALSPKGDILATCGHQGIDLWNVSSSSCRKWIPTGDLDAPIRLELPTWGNFLLIVACNCRQTCSSWQLGEIGAT